MNIKPGDRIRDCDPHYPDRMLMVIRVVDGYAQAWWRGPNDVVRRTCIRLDRIHSDPARRSGWVLLAGKA